jgi:hypothetical protein
MEEDLKWKKTSNGRRPQMDLKILKVEYLSNHSSDPMEDDLKIKSGISQ